jgi:hypothetical protein
LFWKTVSLNAAEYNEEVQLPPKNKELWMLADGTTENDVNAQFTISYMRGTYDASYKGYVYADKNPDEANITLRGQFEFIGKGADSVKEVGFAVCARDGEINKALEYTYGTGTNATPHYNKDVPGCKTLSGTTKTYSVDTKIEDIPFLIFQTQEINGNQQDITVWPRFLPASTGKTFQFYIVHKHCVTDDCDITKKYETRVETEPLYVDVLARPVPQEPTFTGLADKITHTIQAGSAIPESKVTLNCKEKQFPYTHCKLQEVGVLPDGVKWSSVSNLIDPNHPEKPVKSTTHTISGTPTKVGTYVSETIATMEGDGYTYSKSYIRTIIVTPGALKTVTFSPPTNSVTRNISGLANTLDLHTTGKVTSENITTIPATPT